MSASRHGQLPPWMRLCVASEVLISQLKPHVVEALRALCHWQPESPLRHAFYLALENSGHATDDDVFHPGGEGH